MDYKLFTLIAVFISIVSCKSSLDVTDETVRTVVDSVVYADRETQPVTSKFGEDAADDPAIWVHPEDAAKSTIIGTNKKAGFCVYNLKGEELFFYPVGKVNNVDVRYNFRFDDGTTTDIIGASNRTTNSIVLMGINPFSAELTEIAVSEFQSNVDEVYGFCLYYDPDTKKHYAFVNGKDGSIEQWELVDNGNRKIDATIVRTLSVSSQPEGMVADDELGYLYVGEEMRGIWKFRAGADQPADADFIAMSDTSNPAISYDIEGLTIYYGPQKNGYLIASSQGNYRYAIYERGGDNAYITSFSIKDKLIDGVEETDGLDVTNVSLGDLYPHGLLVVQDGYNYESDSLSNQNFKYVRWDKIAKLTAPNLLMDSQFNLRDFSKKN